MLLDIEARIGELSKAEPRISTVWDPEEKRPAPSGQPRKPERLGLKPEQMKQAQQIHSHPEAVAEVIQEAEDNEDIPTKTALLPRARGG